MRAISLWQPWATAIALGSKTIETRHWATDYRGPLAIHAAQRRVKAELLEMAGWPEWVGALQLFAPSNILEIPFGAIVATCNLADCLASEECERTRNIDEERGSAFQWTERDMGGYAKGRFGWILEDIKALRTPIPFKGKQGFFHVPDHILEGAS